MSEEEVPRSATLRVQVLNRQRHLHIPEPLLRQAVQAVLADHGVALAQVNLLLVDNAAIQQLNRRFLNHDWPTDCITFPLESSDHALEGEIVVSAQMACQQAAQFQLTPEEELLLYVIHGALHLVGYDDADPQARQEMEVRQRQYLERFRSRLPRAGASASAASSVRRDGS